MSLVPPVYGWLVGDGGLVMLTADLGTSWQTTPAEPPRTMTSQFDYSALAVRGPKCWVAGSPGTRVLFTPDAGHTWHCCATGQAMGIRALTMVDDTRGWAVGELGTILATADGGQSWQRQRAGGTRAAVLGLFTGPEDVPWELVARLGGNDGFLCAVDCIGRRDLEVAPRSPLDLADRLHEAMVAAGGAATRTAWQFPLRERGLAVTEPQIVAAWNAVHDGRGLEVLDAYLVREIRVWRPEVLVTADPRSAGDAADRLIAQAVLRAAEHAADPAQMPQQISLAGLEPWRVKKIYAALGAGDHGSTDLPAVQLAPRLGRTLADVAAGPRALIEAEFTVPPQTLGFQLLGSQAADEKSRGDFFAGITLWPGGDARRNLLEPPPETMDYLARLAQRRRNTEAIVEQADRSAQQGAQLAAQTNDLVGQLDADGGAWLLYHLAQRYHRGGRGEMAAETYRMLLDRYPAARLGPAGHAVAGAILRQRRGGLARAGGAAPRGGRRQRRPREARLATGTRAKSWPRCRARSSRLPPLALDPMRQEDRPAKAAALANQVEQAQPALFADPRLRFPLAAAHRQQGLGRQADRFYLTASRAASRDAWWGLRGIRTLAERSQGRAAKTGAASDQCPGPAATRRASGRSGLAERPAGRAAQRPGRRRPVAGRRAPGLRS